MSDLLSQDEVDSLFEEDGPLQAGNEGGSGVRAYDLGNEGRIARGRMPTLELVNERFARNFRASLQRYLRRPPEITVGEVSSLKYKSFLNDLPQPTQLNLVTLKSLQGLALFAFDATLISSAVEMLFGGDGKVPAPVEGREFSSIEFRIIRKLLDLALADYSAAWAPVHAMVLEFSRAESMPQFATIAAPNDMVVATGFQIEVGHAHGILHICLPQLALEPIRESLFTTSQNESRVADYEWAQALSKQLQSAEVELVATLASRTATLRQVMGMREGDVMPIQIKELIVAQVDSVPLANCRPGTSNGHYALNVEQVLRPVKDFMA